MKVNNTQKELVFFGKITASTTHEIKNVLAIIQQSSGLLEDFLDMPDSDDFKHKDRFISTLDRIQTQIQRGIGITSNLNHFAHSPDNEKSHIDLNELIQQLSLLASRFAKLKKVSLSTKLNEIPLNVYANPVHLQMHIFNAIEIVLQHIEDGTLTLSLAQDKQIKLHLHHDLMTEDQLNDILSSEEWVLVQKDLCRMGIETGLGRIPKNSVF